MLKKIKLLAVELIIQDFIKILDASVGFSATFFPYHQVKCIGLAADVLPVTTPNKPLFVMHNSRAWKPRARIYISGVIGGVVKAVGNR